MKFHQSQNDGDDDVLRNFPVESEDLDLKENDTGTLLVESTIAPDLNACQSSPPHTVGYFYDLTITGISVKKPMEFKKLKAVSIDNIDTSAEQVFKMSVPIHNSQETVGYDFSLTEVLKEQKCEVQSGLLFQCQVVTNGVSKLHSMPKLFSDFVLLAAPIDLKIATSRRRPGLHVGWEYSAHAIRYRMELIDESSKKIAFSKMLECETGSHGEAVLYKSDFKKIHCTESGSGYQLQMYSLGFGQELIRCLAPSVAEGIFHVIPAEIQYLNDSNTVRVKFKPFINVRVEYIVELCRGTGEIADEPEHLTAKHVYDHEVHDETVLDFPLERWWHLLRSGDLVTAWICSTVTKYRNLFYCGVPQEEVCIMDSPKLQTSPTFNFKGTMSGIRLTWSEVSKAYKYQYGYYLSDMNEYVTLSETQERNAFVTFNKFEQLECGSSYLFQLYVIALGKPGTFLAGEVSLDSKTLQCIVPMEERRIIVFTSTSLQQIWTDHLAEHALSHYFIPMSVGSRHILFSSRQPFPSLNIPLRFKRKFWKTETSLFGKGKN